MAQYLLVHGAWHGAWCWQHVSEGLIRAGHSAHALTLTGLGERSHLLHRGIDLETHVQDVLQALDAQEMQDAILVVHSYAGMLGTAVADRRAHRLKHLVYLDAVVPKPGESWSSTHTSATQKARIDAAAESINNSFPPPDPSVFGLADADYDWVQRRQTPHPGGTYQHVLNFDAARVASVPRTFINCTVPPLATIDAVRRRVIDPQFWDGLWMQNASVIEMKTGHDPMISAPKELTALLLACADQ
jgi:pimeloyl-ACP methyl ester carboxylesterase